MFAGGGGGTTLWDATSANVYWTLAKDNSSNVHLIKITFPASGSSSYNSSAAVNSNVSAIATFSDASPSPNFIQTQFANFVAACTGSNCPPAFDGTTFSGWVTTGISQHYMTIAIWSAQQNSPAWLGAIDVNAPAGSQVIAAMPGWNQPNMNWSGYHTSHPPGNTTPPTTVIVNHFLVGGGTTGPYTTTLTNAIGTSDTLIVVGGTPVGGIANLSTWQPGDILQIDSELMQVQVVTDQQHLSVTRGALTGPNSWLHVCLGGSAATAHAANATVYAMSIDGTCGSNSSGIAGPQAGSAPLWWEFANDPYGQNRLFPNQQPNPAGLNSPFFIEQDNIASHMGYSPANGGTSVSETNGWSICTNQGVAASCQTGGANLAGTSNGSPSFAGVSKSISGNSWDKHPTPVHQMVAPASEQVWGSDIASMFGDGGADNGVTASIASSPSGATESGNVVTITLAGSGLASPLPVGLVTISGVGVSGYNGTWSMCTPPTSGCITPTTTRFTYTDTNTGLANSGGGSVLTWSNVSGSLWSMTPNALWTGTKKLSTLAVNGFYPLLDVSGPSSSIGTGSGDNYKYCYAYKAGECYSGSSAGTLYVNLPTGSLVAATHACTDGTNTVSPRPPFASDNVCFSNWPAYGGELTQFSVTAQDTAGANLRALGQILTPVQAQSAGANPQPTPDGQWLLVPVTDSSGRYYTMEVQASPWPASQSSANRRDFI